MGAFLSTPKTDKIVDSGGGVGVRYGVSAMQGWRVEMEDAHMCKLRMGNYFFGVFDGHAGPKMVQESSTKLLNHIGELREEDEMDVVQKMGDGFLKLDDELKSVTERSGTTAVVCCIMTNKIVFSNCGDSRGLLCRDGQVFFHTEDHKPYIETEKIRIEKAGGTVMMQRVNGSLTVSRALGDFDYKRSMELSPVQQMVSPEPVTTIIERKPEDQFVLLACDGVFDVMDNEEVTKFILNRLQFTDKLDEICSDLIDACLNKVNVTIFIACNFRPICYVELLCIPQSLILVSKILNVKGYIC